MLTPQQKEFLKKIKSEKEREQQKSRFERENNSNGIIEEGDFDFNQSYIDAFKRNQPNQN